MTLLDIEISKLDRTAALLKAAADPLRLNILKVLASNSFNVAELCHIFELRQPALSHHLKLLANAALVSHRKEGTSAFYRRATNDIELSALRSSIFDAIEQLPKDKMLDHRIQDVNRERAATAELFFSTHVDTFAEQQDLIADFPVYGETVAQVIQRALGDRRKNALELGPGRGELLPYLSSIFERVIGVDVSMAMLEIAQAVINKQSLTNVTLMHSDTSALQVDAQDLIVLNMVLHHTPDPAQIFIDLGNVLRPAGKLVICELVRHEQSWVKEACGDLWQGFDQSDLIKWAKQANLVITDSEFFALRNVFQFQILTFESTIGISQ